MKTDSAGENKNLVPEASGLQAAAPAQPEAPRDFAKPIIGGTLVIALIIVAVAGLVLWQLRASIVTSALSDLTALDLVLSKQTERTFEIIDLRVTAIAEAAMAKAPRNPAQFIDAWKGQAQHQRLKETLAGVNHLDVLTVIDADGNIINSARQYPIEPSINVADRDYFIALRDRPLLRRYISEPLQNRLNDEWSIALALRVNAPGGAFLGVVAGMISLKYFEDFYREVSPAPGSGVNLWRSDGNLLARYPTTNASRGRSFTLAQDFQNLALNGGSTVFWTTGKIVPERIAVAVRRIGDFPLMVAISRSETAILAPWRGQAVIVASGVSALLLVLATAAWLLFRHLNAYTLIAAARSEANRESAARQALQRAVERAENAVRELRYSEARFRDIAEIGGDWIWESDVHHRITDVLGSRRPERETHGVSSDEAVGKTRWEMAGADFETDEYWRVHKADLDAHRPFRNFRFSMPTANGDRLHFNVSGKPMFDDAGRFLGYRGTAVNETAMVEALHRAENADALLRDAIDSISEGFAIFDNEDRLVMFNEAYRSHFPANAPSLAPGKRFEDILRTAAEKGNVPNARHRPTDWLVERLRQHHAAEGVVEQPLSDGRWVLISERRMRNGWIAGLRIDITGLKKIQQSLRESQERLDRAQRVAHTGSVERDLRTNRQEWSDETYRIFGVTRENFVPSPEGILGFVHPEDRQRVVEAMSRSSDAHAGSSVRYRIIRPDGAERMLYGEAEVIHDGDGTPLRLVAVIKDITEVAAAERRQAELERQLEHSQRLEALGTLAGGVAHDLNNTLLPIQALSKLLMREFPEKSPARKDLDIIIQASLQARDLVRQILAFSRKQSATKRPIDLRATTRDALQMLRAGLPPTIELVEHLDAVPPMLADASQLQQVIVNLVTNAAQAIGSRNGRIAVRITAAPKPIGGAPDQICISVADSGSGMDEATARRIFEPFFTTKAVGEGTGLGLSVVHGIVTGHGGTIEVRSNPGMGSEFVILLPACGCEEPTCIEKDVAA